MAGDVRLFISHTTRDQRDFTLAHKLAEGLRAWGIEVWIAPESIPPGERWETVLVSGILDQSSHFLVILSEAAVRAPWVLKEIALARSRYESGSPIKILPLHMGRLGEFENAEFLSAFQSLPYSDQFSTQLRTLAKALSLPPAVPALFRTLIEETTRSFVGREKVFGAFQQFVANERKGYFVLIGDPGEGKTTVLAEYVRRTGCPAHFNIAPAGIDTTEQFYESVSRQLAVHYDVSSTLRPGETPSFSLQIMDMLEQAAAARPHGEPFVLVIDALDEVRQPENDTANVLQLPQTLPEGVFLLMSRRRKEIPFVTRERVESFDLRDYPSENRSDIERYLTKRLNEPAFQPWLDRRKWTIAKAVAEFADYSENNFMYLYYVLGELATGGFEDPTEQLPMGLMGYYSDHWRRMGMMRRPVPELKLNVLCVLSLLRGPVSVRLVSEIVNAPLLEVRSVIDEWREFLSATVVEGETRYRLYHFSFQEFLQSREVLQDIGITRYREQLAAYFTKQLFQ